MPWFTLSQLDRFIIYIYESWYIIVNLQEKIQIIWFIFLYNCCWIQPWITFPMASVYNYLEFIGPPRSRNYSSILGYTYILDYIYVQLYQRCLYILERYGLGPRTIRILRMYWVRIQMVEKAGKNYWLAFQIHHRVPQGDPLSPKIFNVVVDAVIRHWVKVVGGLQGRYGWEGLGTSIETLSLLFYSDDRLVACPDIAHLQGVFDDLTGLFDCLGLRTNEGKTASMVCWPCQTPHAW